MTDATPVSFPDTTDLRALAARVVWFKASQDALRDPLHLIAHALTYGAHDDVTVLRRYVSDDQLRTALSAVPPGIVDARSWAYWRLKLGLDPQAELPRRKLG